MLSPFLSLIFLSFAIALHSSPTPPHQSHFTKHGIRQTSNSSSPQQYFEVTKPLPFDSLNATCTLPILTHDFGYTLGLPPVSVTYSPPSNCTWTNVTLEIRVSCQGEQYDRIAAVWLAGAELMRTSTAEPTDEGVFWIVRKDITRYTSLLAQRNLTLSVMLENIVNDVFTGVYQVNVTFFYYDKNPVVPVLSLPSDNHKLNRKLQFANNPMKLNMRGSYDLYEKPADLIIPISKVVGDDEFWFRIQRAREVYSRRIQIPRNSYRALIEVYVSFHGNDEFWYSNPPDSYIRANKLNTARGNGAYREVLVTIDGTLVGSVVPLPVIFTGGINPLFWEPVVSIGAFNLPSYDFDITPFLGMLLDGNKHIFGLSVADSLSFWLVDANLHLWLDSSSSEVQAKVDYSSPDFSVERELKFQGLDGKFKIEAERESKISGWVNSTAGNFTTSITQELKFKNTVKFSKNGTTKSVEQKVKEKSETRIESDTGLLISRSIVKRKYPLKITTENQPGNLHDTYLMITSLENSVQETKTIDDLLSNLRNSQQCKGWMLVQDHDVLSGAANTVQNYNYRDGSECYSRMVAADNGKLLNDTVSLLCASS